MNVKTPLFQILSHLVKIGLVSIFYYLVGRLGGLLYAPAGITLSQWLPSGLALVLLFFGGWQAGIGVFLGSFFLSLEILGVTWIPLAVLLAAVVVIQSWGWNWIIRRLGCSSPPETIWQTLQVIGVSGLVVSISPAVGMIALSISALAPRLPFLHMIRDWWFVNLATTLVLTPALIVIYWGWQKKKMKEPFLWPLTSAIIGLTLFSFLVSEKALETQRLGTLQAESWVHWSTLLAGFSLGAGFLVYVYSRQKIESILIKSNAEFRALSDDALTGVLRMNLKGEVLYANQSIAKILGLESPELLLFNKLHPYISDRAQYDTLSQVLAETKQIYDREMVLLTAQGEKRYVIYSASLNQDLVTVSAVNITDRKRAEEKEHNSQMRLDLALNTAKAGFWDWKIPTNELIINRRYAEMLGYPLNELEPLTIEVWNGLCHPDDRAKSERLLAQYLAGEIISFEIEIRLKHKNGDWIWVSFTGQFTEWDEFDKPLRLTGIYLDIAERKRAEFQLRDSESRLNQAQQITHVGSWLVDYEKKERKWSNEIYRIFDVMPGEFQITYEAFLEKIHPDDRVLMDSTYTLSLATQKPYDIVYRVLHSGGRIKFVQEKCETQFDKNGNPIRSIGTVQDITERRQMELEIRERMKELTCLFSVSSLLENNIAPEDEICSKILDYLIPAMQFPQLAVAVIELNGRRYTQNELLPKLAHNLSSSILVNGEVRGSLSVFYTRQEPFIIPEEQFLIDDIVRMLGLWLARKYSEMQLKESHARFQQLAENIEEVFWLFDIQQNRIVYISPVFETVWGRSCESMYNDHHEYLDSILSEDLPIMLAALAQQDNAETTSIEYRILHTNGGIRWIWDRSFPILDDSGSLIRYAGVATDITDLKNSQLELEKLNRELEKRVEERTAEVRESEAIYRALFENSNDAIFLFSPAGVQLQANQRGLDMIGYTQKEYGYQGTVHLHPLTPPEQQADANDRFATITRGESVPLYERTVITKDGKRIETEVNLSAVRDSAGKVILVQSVVRDITERKNAEKILLESRDKLSAANAALEKASRLKDEFLASMSHELRTPLTGILGFSEALQMQSQGALNEKQLKAVVSIEKSGRHLLELINDILDLSKIEAGKLDIQFEICSVAEICQASLQLVKGMAYQKKQNINFSMNQPSIMVRADKRRLKQILVNLLSNAIKFTPESGDLGLEVQVKEDARVVLFSVWDKGIGIRQDEFGKLFKPFVQLDSGLVRQHAGTGLGLSLVHRMVDLHGGGVEVQSTLGQGSRFTIILPWAAYAAQPLTVSDNFELLAVKHVLILDDNQLDLEKTVGYIKEMGMEGVVHHFVEDAVKKAASLRPGAILLDVNLSAGAGMELLTHLQADENTCGIPVIITSIQDRRSESIKSGAFSYLNKPFALHDLREELKKAADFVFMPDQFPGSGHPAPSVLIADDSEVTLDQVSDFLGRLGLKAYSARNGLELLELASVLKPDMIMVDIQMVGMDGFETVKRLRASRQPDVASIPVLAITALAIPGDQERCLEAGVNEYLCKPITIKQLSQKIKQLYLGEK